MKNRREYRAALAAEYALGTLRGPARQQFEEHMRQDAQLAAEVIRWQEAFTQLDNSLPLITPPPSVWKKIQRQLPVSLEPLPTVSAKRTTPLTRYLGWAIAAGLAALLLMPRLLVQPAPLVPVAILTNAQSAANQGQWVVSADKSTRSLTLTPLQTAGISANHSLELWAIPGGGKPRSLGLLDTQSPTQLTLAANMPESGVTLAISLEPKGGSPTGQPTGTVLYSGRISM
ncbi:anti-sigma factor [Rouxiella sp. Mn2063]|uniref:anti-sigma factor n=1 Tax=Rouxiella sp. Mn2063 TaxID=3395262 RepID=UPI003BCBA8DE